MFHLLRRVPAYFLISKNAAQIQHITYIYISRRAMSGYVVVAPNRKNKSDVRTCTANECTDMIDTSQIDHTLPVVKNSKCFQSAHFCRGQWGKVSGLYAGDLLFQACFSSTPEATPGFLKVYWKLDPYSFGISQEGTVEI